MLLVLGLRYPGLHTWHNDTSISESTRKRKVFLFLGLLNNPLIYFLPKTPVQPPFKEQGRFWGLTEEWTREINNVKLQLFQKWRIKISDDNFEWRLDDSFIIFKFVKLKLRFLWVLYILWMCVKISLHVIKKTTDTVECRKW